MNNKNDAAVNAAAERAKYVEDKASDMRQRIAMRKTALGMLPQVLFTLDVSGYVRFISTGFGRYSEAELVGKHFTEILPDEVLVKLQCAMLEAQAKPNSPIHWEAEVPTAAGVARFKDIIAFTSGIFVNSGTLHSLD